MPSASCIALYGEYVGYHSDTETEVYNVDGFLYTLREEFNHNGVCHGEYIVGHYQGQLDQLS